MNEQVHPLFAALLNATASSPLVIERATVRSPSMSRTTADRLLARQREGEAISGSLVDEALRITENLSHRV